MFKLILFCSVFVLAVSLPQTFDIKKFKVGIEYAHSLPMSGGSERFRHRNNLDPFYVTVTATAKNGYVITYLELTTTTDANGIVDFTVVRGQTGSKTMVFHLASNQTDFLSYSYLVYGIREEEYKKLNNIISIQMRNTSKQHGYNCFTIIVFLFFIMIML